MSWVNDVIPQIPSIVSAAAAAAAAYAAGRSARLAGQQVTNQQAQFEASMQPYVWVDIRPRDEDGQLLVLVVGNSGPTVATNVRIWVDEDVPHAPRHREHLQRALDRFNSGHASLPPGRSHSWGLGTAVEILNDPEVDRRITVTIGADGPYGPVEALSYRIDLNDWRETSVQARGSMYRLEKALQSMEKALVKTLRK